MDFSRLLLSTQQLCLSLLLGLLYDTYRFHNFLASKQKFRRPQQALLQAALATNKATPLPENPAIAFTADHSVSTMKGAGLCVEN